MAQFSHIFLATIVVLALLSIASAEYMSGRSLKPYHYEDRSSHKEGRGLESYEPEEDDSSHKPGHSLHSYKPEDKKDAIYIQGMVYCRESKELVPMQGATARVTCMLKDKNGDEKAPLSVKTPLTDKNGYFLINLTKYATAPGYTLSSCKVFLNEPAKYCDCNVPTDTSDGLSGAHPSRKRRLSDNAVIYSVAPFAFKPSSY